VPVAPGPSDSELAERLAARTLELVDIPSESRAEAALAGHVAGVLRAGGAEVSELGDSCLLARPPGTRPDVLLAGHLDTVPAQDNLPGSRDGSRVHGLGASDMKGALAVMIELVLDGAPYGALFFPREELPSPESALVPLLERSPVTAGLVVMMEPTDGELHAGCLGNINATWTFRGRSGHSARPWQAENAITRAALGVAQLASAPSLPVAFHGLTFQEVASVTRIGGGIAANVIPETCTAQVNFRYAPGRTPEEAEARLRELCGGLGELEITGNAGSAPVALDHPLARRLIEAGDLAVAPKQAWTPVAEFAAAGVDAVNFGPRDPAYACLL
jgi:succinyl-diaminopimelate desuccinylase